MSVDPITQVLFGGLMQTLVSELSKPENIETFLQELNGHTAIDIAQDALDAYRHGHLTKESALFIVERCLNDGASKTIEARIRHIK